MTYWGKLVVGITLLLWILRLSGAIEISLVWVFILPICSIVAGILIWLFKPRRSRRKFGPRRGHRRF